MAPEVGLGAAPAFEGSLMHRSLPSRFLHCLAIFVLLSLASRMSRAELQLIPHVDRLGPDIHQRGLWTCSCCALTYLVEWHRFDATGKHRKLSPMHLYRHSQQYRMIEGCFEGGLMDMSYLMRIASLHGVVPESRYPYRLRNGSMRRPISRQWARDMSRLTTGGKRPSPLKMLDHYFPPPVSISRSPVDGFYLRRQDFVIIANSKLIRYAADWVRVEEGQPKAFIDYNVDNYKSDRFLAVAFDRVHPSAAKLFERLIERLDAGKPVLMGYMEDGVTEPVIGGTHWHFIVAVGHDPASGQVVARNSYGSQRLTTYSYAFLRAKLFQLVYAKADALPIHATPDVAGFPHLLGNKALDMDGVLGVLGGQDPLPAKLVKLGVSRQEAIVLLDLRAARRGRQLSRLDIYVFVSDLRESVRTGRCPKLKWHVPRSP